MAPSSNAIATVTIQEQDLLATTLPIIVQRSLASVTFPSSNALVYGGYVNVLSASFVNLFLNQNVPFVYIRNASASGNSTLFLELTPSGGSMISMNLTPGGIFLWANTLVIGGNNWGTIAYAATVGAPVSMEYLFAY